MKTLDAPTAPPTTQTLPPVRLIARLTTSLLALVIVMLAWTTSVVAQPTTTDLRRDLAEAVELAKQANADAKQAIADAQAAKAQRDDARKQRDEYKTEAYDARTDRDNLAGELAAYEAFLRRDRMLADERLVAQTHAEAAAKKAKRQRWIWAGAAAAIGIVIGASVVVVIDKAIPEV